MRKLLKSPLYVTLAIVVLGVLTQSLQAFDHIYWNVWFKNRAQIETNNAVVISLDNGVALSEASVASSTAQQAKLLGLIGSARPQHVFFDFPQISGDNVQGDAALRTAIGNFGDGLTMVRRSQVRSGLNKSIPLPSDFGVPYGVKQAVSAWDVNFLGYAEKTESSQLIDGAFLPAVAVTMRSPRFSGGTVYPDPRFDLHSVRVISARDVLNGKVGPDALAGRLVFVTNTNSSLDTALGYFGFGVESAPAALVDYSGMRSASRGNSINLGWLPGIACFALAMYFGTRLTRRRYKVMLYAGFVVVAILLPGYLREHAFVLSIGPTFAALLLYAPLRSSQKWRSRVQLTSSASGLPNIAAMSTQSIDRTQDVVAVSVSQYEQMMASLPRELHGECARQIARRLSLGAGDRQIFDNDNGHFVWLEESKTLDGLIEHLEGLRALFSSPLVIGGHVLDTTVHFGVDRNIDSKPISRIQSALASANEAQGKGKLYEEFNEQRLAQSPWELSLHARIDEGLRNGDIWLALQPQYDFRNRRFSGAEALIRWNDPVRGVIPPDAFILQAERAGRIEAITFWVLEKSISMLEELNRVAGPFQISVNLSARMVDHPALVHRVSDIVRERGLRDCSLITFEVTETFSMANREQAKRNLAALRTMG
ncbi:EAL domain-containing protein, partial [Novosphingobium sp.]|uniref:EAL domain-containing protein n=1 Tax=Novosphingobium sp. TaxID=1874826 RepID=UPI0035AE23F6